MKKALLIILLYILQCYIVMDGRELFGRDGNPFVLFIVSIIIPIWFLYQYKIADEEPISTALQHKLTGFIAGAAIIVLLIPFFKTLFAEFPDPASLSDVIPQLDTQYTRFMLGEQPYYPLPQFEWHPFPVYMPMHWLPLAIPYAMKIDVRWVGIICMAIANGFWGAFVWGKGSSIVQKTIVTLLPAIVLVGYLHYARLDIGISLETVIAAYYMILSIGLASKNIWLTTAGIILCLLSRYTLVFWLPLFAVLLWMNKPAKTSIIIWVSVIASILFIYIIPFYLKDPTILAKGVHYHNSCAIAEWEGFGDPDYLNTFGPGIYFAPYLKQLLPGTMEHRVFLARGIQALLMIGLVVWGILYYRKRRKAMGFYDLSLVMLYLIVLTFYMFSPLLFKYYYIALLCISAIVCGKMLLKSNIKKDVINLQS